MEPRQDPEKAESSEAPSPTLKSILSSTPHPFLKGLGHSPNFLTELLTSIQSRCHSLLEPGVLGPAKGNGGFLDNQRSPERKKKMLVQVTLDSSLGLLSTYFRGLLFS